MSASRTRPARVYAGRSPAERAAERRARLLAAGLELFGTRGYAATTIPEVCTEARVTARHFYEGFASREALLRAVYDQVIDHARAAVAAALAPLPADPQLHIEAGVSAFVHAYLDDPRHVRIACVEIVGVSPELERHRRSVIHEFAALIEAQARALVDDSARDHSLTALALAGAHNELLVEWVYREHRPPAQVIVDEVTALYTAVLTRWRPR